MSFFTCAFTSSAPTNFLIYAVFACMLGIVFGAACLVDRLLAGKLIPRDRTVTMWLVAWGIACGASGLWLQVAAATGVLSGNTCMPRPFVALWLTLFTVVTVVAAVACRHVLRTRGQRKMREAMGC
jgi:hypothetical protein